MQQKTRFRMTSLKALSLFTLFLLWYVPAGDAEAGKLIDKLRKNHLCDNDSTKLAQKRWDACSSEAPVVDVNNKVHGDVFDCDCWTKSALGGKVLNIRKVNRYDDSTVEEGEKYVAVFSPGDKNNDNCKCAVVTDLIEPWHALDNNQCLRYERRSKKTKHAIKRRRKTIYYNVCVERGPKQVGYASSCIGLCGAHCGIDDRGQEISEYNKRYASLVIHDVCQAYINSTASMASKEGRRNNCGDEGSKSGGAARDAMGGVGTIAATGLFNGHCGPKCQDMKDLGGNVCDN